MFLLYYFKIRNVWLLSQKCFSLIQFLVLDGHKGKKLMWYKPALTDKGRKKGCGARQACVGGAGRSWMCSVRSEAKSWELWRPWKVRVITAKSRFWLRLCGRAPSTCLSLNAWCEQENTFKTHLIPCILCKIWHQNPRKYYLCKFTVWLALHGHRHS